MAGGSCTATYSTEPFNIYRPVSHGGGRKEKIKYNKKEKGKNSRASSSKRGDIDPPFPPLLTATAEAHARTVLPHFRAPRSHKFTLSLSLPLVYPAIILLLAIN